MIAVTTFAIWVYALYVGLRFNKIDHDLIVMRPYAIKSQVTSIVMIFVYCLIIFYHLIAPESSHDMVLFASLLVISRQLFENHKALNSLTKKRKSDDECQIHG